MSTRSYIGTLSNEKVEYIYCHFDGYLEGVGRTLVNHYDSPVKVENLLALGDISELRETPETCVAYHRDRGEPLNKRGAHTRRAIVKDDNVDYVYLYNMTTFEWEAYCTYDGALYRTGENITDDLMSKASLVFV